MVESAAAMALLTIRCGDGDGPGECAAAIIVPEQALHEPGYITMIAGPGTAVDKHSLQALAQTACYQFQDEELEVAEMTGPCRIVGPGGETELARGLVVYREASGAIGAAVHSGLSARKLLAAAHRYCTRWVRLDI